MATGLPSVSFNFAGGHEPGALADLRAGSVCETACRSLAAGRQRYCTDRRNGNENNEYTECLRFIIFDITSAVCLSRASADSEECVVGLIMISGLSNQHGIVLNLVHETMLIVYSPGPISSQSVSERLGLPGSLERRACNLFDQFIDTLE